MLLALAWSVFVLAFLFCFGAFVVVVIAAAASRMFGAGR